MIQKPTAAEYAPFYHTYVSKVGDDIFQELIDQTDILSLIIEENEDRLDYAYEKDKWSIRELVIHMIDTEQIFAYRLLRIARGDDTPLAGFNQNDYINNNNFSHLGAGDLIRMLENQRANTFSIIDSLTEDTYTLHAEASNHTVSVRALVYIIAGHMEHHIRVLRERYID